MTGLVELTEHTFSGGRPKRTEETANPGRTCKLHRKALPSKSYCEATVLTTDPSCCPIIVAHCYRFYLRAVISLFLFMQCSCQPPHPSGIIVIATAVAKTTGVLSIFLGVVWVYSVIQSIMETWSMCKAASLTGLPVSFHFPGRCCLVADNIA